MLLQWTHNQDLAIPIMASGYPISFIRSFTVIINNEREREPSETKVEV